MWDRVTFKNRAKAIMKEHYWKVFFACLIASLLGATGNSENYLNLNIDTDALAELLQSRFDLNLVSTFYDLDIPLHLFSSAFAVFLVFVVIIAFIIGLILSSFIFSILRVGFCRYLILTQRYGYPADMGEIFWGFGCGHYLNLVKTMFLHDLYIFLWSLLLFVPGIIKAYEYTCVPYILAENPDMDYRQVLQRSKRMTDGHKFDIFVLALSFLGWEFLGAMLFGIGGLFVAPYIELTNGEMYAYLRSRIEPPTGEYQEEYANQHFDQDYSQGYASY